MLRFVLGLVAAFALTAPVGAAPLSVRVVNGAGRPVPDAVVTIYPSGQERAPRAAGRAVIAQQNLQFRPFLTIVPAGTEISFPNFDNTRHHVYSFSPAKKFELKLFARDQSRTVRFDKPGVVALGCNIHDQMSAFIVVTDSAWTARTNANGVATFADVPDVPARVTLWHPYLRAPGGKLEKMAAAGQRALVFSAQFRSPPPAMPMAY